MLNSGRLLRYHGEFCRGQSLFVMFQLDGYQNAAEATDSGFKQTHACILNMILEALDFPWSYKFII